jgi:uncharacterized phage protein gp47/JayE
MTAVPKIDDVRSVILNSLQSSFNQRIPLLPKAFNRVLSKTVAGVVVTLYKYGAFMGLQQFVRFATNEETEINGELVKPLTEEGRKIGIGDPVGGTRAEFEIEVVVTNQVGQLDANSQLLNDDNGVTYLTIGAVALSAPTVTATIRASKDQSGGNGSGSIGNMDLGETVSFANPIPNVERDTTVTKQTVQGANAEETEAYRQRIIDFYQKRPQGGAYADYEQWGEETAGIINTYPYTGDPGEVDLYSEATPESSGSDDGIPTAAQLVAVKESVELNVAGKATRRNVNAFVNSYAITRTGFTVEVTGLVADDLATTQEKIVEAVEQYFLSREPFIHGLSIEPRRDRIVNSEVSGAVANVASSFGATFVSVVVKEASVVIQLRQLGVGEKAKATSVTFP